MCANTGNDLLDVLSAWPLLPDAIKMAITGIVRPYLADKCQIIVHGRAPNGDFLGTLTNAAVGDVQVNPCDDNEQVAQHSHVIRDDD